MLKEISRDANSARWSEFYHAYEGTMRGFLKANFPALEADDIIQDTMLALMSKLPEYRYSPDGKGLFRNYLVGILKHKAMHALDKLRKRTRIRDAMQDEREPALPATQADDEENWQAVVMEAAIGQLMADTTIPPRNREIFRCVALCQEPPAEVAARFGVTRGNVDVIKSRMIDRLSALVRNMCQVA